MNNFDYKRFHTEVEALANQAAWYRQAGNKNALLELRRKYPVTLPPTYGGHYIRASFFRVFIENFIPRILSTDNDRAASAMAWYQENMRWHNNQPPILITR